MTFLKKSSDMFSEQKNHFDLEARRLDVDEIPETDLTLSPILLKSPFLNEHVLAGMDPYGSDAGIVDPGTAIVFWTPSSSLGERSGDRVNDTELEPVRPTGEPVISKGTSEVAPQLGDKGSAPSGGNQTDKRMLEIFNFSLYDQIDSGEVGAASAKGD